MLILTPKEADALVQFREKLGDLKLDADQNSDAFLIRWLRARDLNVAKAEDMLRKSLKWRVENNIDSIMEWKAPEIYHKLYPNEICGYDKFGHPVLVAPSRFFNMDVFWELDRDEYIQYNIQNIEILLKAMKKYSTPEKPITEFIGIYDVAGFNFRSVMNRKGMAMMQDSTKVFEENYPELIHKAYVVNAPKFFTFIYSMMKHCVPKRTLAKFEIFGTDKSKWAEVLLKQIPAEVLPTQYGGTNAEFYDKAFANCGVKAGDRKVSITGEIEMDGFMELHIPAGKKLEFEYDIELPNTSITWCFKTENYDVGFSVTYGKDSEVVIPYHRVESQNKKQKGTHLCKSIGKYMLIFDNTFSRMRSKTLHLKVDIEEPFLDSLDIEIENTPEIIPV